MTTTSKKAVTVSFCRNVHSWPRRRFHLGSCVSPHVGTPGAGTGPAAGPVDVTVTCFAWLARSISSPRPWLLDVITVSSCCLLSPPPSAMVATRDWRSAAEVMGFVRVYPLRLNALERDAVDVRRATFSCSAQPTGRRRFEGKGMLRSAHNGTKECHGLT